MAGALGRRFKGLALDTYVVLFFIALRLLLLAVCLGYLKNMSDEKHNIHSVNDPRHVGSFSRHRSLLLLSSFELYLSR